MKNGRISSVLPTAALLAGPLAVLCHGESALDSARAGGVRPAVAIGNIQAKGFPRLLSGNGWETTVVLLDLGATPVTFRQSFLGNTGSPTSFTVQLQSNTTPLTTSALQGTLQPNGMITYTLHDDGSSVREGWSLITFDAIQNQLGGYAILRHAAAAGGLSFEVTLPLGDLQDFSAHLPFDNSGGFQTEITAVNPASNLAAHVRLTYFNSQGEVMLLDVMTLKPGEQATFVLPNTYPDLANQSGMIAIASDINCLAVAGLRYNPSSGAIASVPVMNFGSMINLQ